MVSRPLAPIVIFLVVSSAVIPLRFLLIPHLCVGRSAKDGHHKNLPTVAHPHLCDARGLAPPGDDEG